MALKLKRPSPSVVVAIPTITERGSVWEDTAETFRLHTCQPVQVIASYAEGGWGAGLNDAWEQVRETPPDVFVCGSDDMLPEDDNWLPPLLDALEKGVYPAPTVIDPRWTNYGGHRKLVPDGTPSKMSSFPILHGGWGDTVFPLPEDLSYFADNLIAVKLLQADIECVAVPSSKIRHLWLKAGRGFGHGSENRAMIEHSKRYTQALEEIGVDRSTLPSALRGAHFTPVRGRART